MKTILTVAILLTTLWARAGVIVSQTFSPNLTIPAGDPTGVTEVGSFAAATPGEPVLGITVGLDITGGYNGDLYGYLIAPNGTKVTLMNQPGSGLGGDDQPGMNITLSDIGASSIQNIPDPNPDNYPNNSILTGTYQADQNLGTFGSSVANGSWTVFFADLGSGGGTPTLDSWSLNIDVEAVPEPVNLALTAFAAIMLTVAGCRQALRRVPADLKKLAVKTP